MTEPNNRAVEPIAFVGAGPGDVELITVKGRRLLDHADCIVYAGSLVNPAILKDLPSPDRVFIGGSGGQLRDIIDHAAERLRPGGRIVVNAVLEKTAQEAPAYLHVQGLEVTLSEIKVSRRSYPEQQSQAMHPITIIVGRKKNTKQEKTDEWI